MILIIAFTFRIFLTLAHADGRSIAVQTDKPCYYYGDRVNVSGVLTYNGYAAQSIDLSMVVRLSGSTGPPYYLKTTTTGNNGGYCDTFPLEGPNAILGTYIVNVTATIADVSVTNQTTFRLIMQDGSLVRVEAWAKTGSGNQLVKDAAVSIPPWNSSSGWVGFNITLSNQGKTGYVAYGMLATADQDPNPNMVMAAVNATGVSLLTSDGFSEQAWNASKVYARSFLNNTYKTNTFEFKDLDNCSAYILLLRELKNETENRPILISVKETWLEESKQPSPVTTTTTIRSGFASVNQTTIGMALNITGSSAQGGTEVTVNSTDFDTVQPNGTGELQINGVAFYDLKISSSAPLGSNAMASVLITNANFSSQSSAVSYWNGSSWVTVTSQFIPPDSVLVNLLASDLSGTPIMVGIPEFPAMLIPVLFIIATLLAGLVYKRAKGLPCSAFRTDQPKA
jgi:hypothetical protein